tara:strand:- start:565 stop:801 length:237 start_codon:yes stop_codon:yes gene_type:complete
MSSPFQKSFSAKNPMSPIKNTQKKAGAYVSGADGMVTQSDRAAFDGLTNSIVGTTLDVFERANKKKGSDEDSYYYDYD